MTRNIAISRILFPVTSLGPGRRIGIWFQGCSIRCSGCISADTWSHSADLLSVEELIELIADILSTADGVTISGGEPFDQFPALCALLEAIRPRLQHNADVLVYSGYCFTDLAERLRPLDGLIDSLISGPFDVSQPQTRPLLGSDNQELHLLSTRGQRNLAGFLRHRNESDDQIDLLMNHDGTVWMAGVPRRGDLERLRNTLVEQGVYIRTTEDRQPES